MLFFTILIFLQIQTIICPLRNMSEHNEYQLAKTTYSYFKYVYPEKLPTFEDTEDDGNLISLETLQLLRHLLRIVLEQLSNLYSTKLPSIDVLDHPNKEYEVELEVSELQKPFEAAVCSFIPRCLDILTNFMDEISKLFHLYQLHNYLCTIRPAKIKTECTKKENDRTTTYLCNADHILFLHVIVRNFPEVPKKTDYNKQGADFLSKTFHSANNIDRKQMIKTLHLNPKKNVFKGVEYDFFVAREEFPLYNLNRTKTKNLTKTFLHLNSEYADIFMENLNGLPIPDAVNRLFIRALKAIEMNFKYIVYNVYDDESKQFTGKTTETSDRNYNSKVAIVTFFDELCKFTPLILVYLTDNCSSEHVAETEVPFSMHLTFCINWMTFLMKHCPQGASVEDEWNCIVNTILDRLMINSFYITGDVSDFDDMILNEQLTRSAFAYVKKTYNALINYYDDPTINVPIWTTSDWLTGRHFLVNNYVDSAEMNSLKDKPILIPAKDEDSATEVTLKDAYNVLLPWHSNMRTILAFHEVLTSHIDLIMDEFVYKHSKCISLYLEYTGYFVNQAILERLGQSVLWYTEGAEEYREYLSFPGPRKPIREEVDEVISAIKNLKYIGIVNIDSDTTNIMKAIPAEKQEELTRWVKNELSDDLGTEYYLKRLNTIISKNCLNATFYMSIVYTVAHQSKVITENRTSAAYQNNYCTPYVSNVFVDVPL